jgi:hypothetical protein
MTSTKKHLRAMLEGPETIVVPGALGIRRAWTESAERALSVLPPLQAFLGMN